MKTLTDVTSINNTSTSDVDSDEEFGPLRCWDCNINFTERHYLYSHLYHHIKQPSVILHRVSLPPLKLTLKNKSNNNFEIINSPTYSNSSIGSPSSDSNSQLASNLAEQREEPEGAERAEVDEIVEQVEGEAVRVSFSPNFADISSPAISEISDPSEKTTDSIPNANSTAESNASECGSIPGAEPTPPPEPSPDYPKIRIKTTGLLKEPLTITEITDDNPDGDPNSNQNSGNIWTTPSLEDPLKLPDNDDGNIMSLFNNNERAKDLGFHTSDEFISLDGLEDRNRGAMQLYNPSTSQSQNTLESITGLPMQALAQQVSRLQPSGNNGLHQQNVLINIQQFPSGPPQPAYQPPPMYPHYPPQPMHQPYQYQSSYRPPNPMYYPPAPPGYPHQMPPPPQPQLTQLQPPPLNQQPMGQPPMSQQQMSQNQNSLPTSQPQNVNQMSQQSSSYRQPMPPRQNAPRPQVPGNRMPNARPPMGPRQPMARQRFPVMRPRGAGMTAVRSVRPRMGTPQNGMRPQQQMTKRSPEQMQSLQAKKKKFDLLTPDKDDDDCQVICMQPKNTDGGLPQIESVQGGTSETAESSIMHLSDSITLSVRNPPPKPASPKKSDAKAVANILATRGITVTATAKPKEKQESPQKNPPALPTSLNLNGAVSIIPAAKSNGNTKSSNNPNENLPTVDLTDDATPPPPPPQPPAPQQKQRQGLPYRCDLCPAQYPNAVGLNKHRQTYHKTTGGMCDLGIPLINLKQPGIMQKLTTLGISNYIPLPSSGGDGMFALPIVNARNPGNIAGMGANMMLSLGPVRTIQKPQSNIAAKPLPNQKS